MINDDVAEGKKQRDDGKTTVLLGEAGEVDGSATGKNRRGGSGSANQG